MKEFKTWSWGFVPAIAALGFIWFEFWQAGNRERPAGSGSQYLFQTTTPLSPENRAAVTRAAAATSPVASTSPAAKPVVATPATVPAALAATQDVDVRLFTEPPPVSLAVNQVSLGDLAKALNSSLNGPVTVSAPDARDLRYSLEVKNKPFWEVFQALQEQAPFIAVENTSGLQLQPADAQGGIRRFQRHGPAILFARTLSYTRSGNPSGTFSLVLGTLVDPRLKVLKHGPITVLNAADETGRVQAIPELPVGDNLVNRQGNYWTQSVNWPATATNAKSITFQCQVFFVAESSTANAVVEEVENKASESIAVGDRSIRLTAISWASPTFRMTLSQPEGTPVSWTIQDSTGKIWGTPNTTASSATFNAADAKPPFRLILKGTLDTRASSYQFELPEIPVP